MKTKNLRKQVIVSVGLVASGLMAYSIAMAQVIDPPPTLETLKGVTVPLPAELDQYIVNRAAAIQLGKAAFWDMAVGSDGKTACASCHFHAGADSRVTNQTSPGLRNETPGFVAAFNPSRTKPSAGPNYWLVKEDFPFHVLSDPNDRKSDILFTTDDVVSSQGVFATNLAIPLVITGGAATDKCVNITDPHFQIGGQHTRRVEPRNSPTTINAVFNFRNFWDGRANNAFNGVNPFGPRDTTAGIYTSTSTTSPLTKVKILLENASLASQAAGPPGSDFEMSCANRTGAMMGRRLLGRKALYGQQVAIDDSVLAPLRNPTAPAYGLTKTYLDLVKLAFAPKYWQSSAVVGIGGVSYYQREANFTLFFSLAVMLYESTLVSDDAPIDRLLTGTDSNALTALELQGMGLFLGKGKCINCHKGPELTGAGSVLQKEKQEKGLVERMIMGDNNVALYDNGFYNIGVRPTVEDIGTGGKDPFGNPLSWTRQYQNFINTGNPSKMIDKFEVDPCTFDVDPCITPSPNFREAVDGAFKTPTLRNVELTGPYFHNGSRSSLAQVVEFYNRGGDRRDGGPCSTADSDTTGFNNNCSNLDADITNLELTPEEQEALVAFMKKPLTDNRVRCEIAPFDHPQLKINLGQLETYNTTTGARDDYFQIIPAIGKGGRCLPGGKGPLLPFEDILISSPSS
jgi:cytochrome c peroxidase